MKRYLFIIAALAISYNSLGQSKSIDLSKAPNQNKPIHKKSNAELLSETKEQPKQEKDAFAPAPDAANNNTSGTYNKHLQITPTPNNMLTLSTEPSMMKAQQQQGRIGNMNTNSTIYYDNSGKIRSSKYYY